MSKYYPEKKKEQEFLDLKVPIFKNKKNGQISLALPKRELKDFLEVKDDNKKFLPIRIFKWRKK